MPLLNATPRDVHSAECLARHASQAARKWPTPFSETTETRMTSKKFDPSRRNLCREGVALVGGAVAAGPLLKNKAFAQSRKVPQSAVQYQGHPKGQDECDRCTHFVPGKTSSAEGTCQVVQGSLDPQGWCVMLASKG